MQNMDILASVEGPRAINEENAGASLAVAQSIGVKNVMVYGSLFGPLPDSPV